MNAEKLAAYGNPQEFAKLVPDLVVEVISTEVKYGYLQRKIRDYFEAGVRLLWIVDPELQTVTVYRSPSSCVYSPPPISCRAKIYFSSFLLPGG